MRKKTRRFVKELFGLVLLAGTLTATAQNLAGCGDTSTGPGSSGCGDCPASVSWDSGVDRCRDNSNGQFAKSCCCGH